MLLELFSLVFCVRFRFSYKHKFKDASGGEEQENYEGKYFVLLLF